MIEETATYQYKVSPSELKERQSFSMSEKVLWSIRRYLDFIEVFGVDGVYLSYSGGKDSDVINDIIEKVHSGYYEYMIFRLEPIYQFLYKHKVKGKPSPPKCFCNTGLEFPEIVDHVKKTVKDVVILKPQIGFTRFIKEFGVAVGSKTISMQIRRLKTYISNPSEKNENTKRLYLTGIKSDGSKSKSSKLANRWIKLLEAPFKVTDKCCDNFKKKPFKEYEKITGKKPITGVTADESDQRAVSYMKTGCNSFTQGKEMSRPLSIWTLNDIWEYSKYSGLVFCEVYYDRFVNGVFVPGEKQTGCMFCLFGLHLEKGQNRIQRMAKSHPKQYDILINKLGFREILEWLKIPYRPIKNCGKQMEVFKPKKEA